MLITKLDALFHVFIYLFILYLYMFQASQCSSSGDRIVLILQVVLIVLFCIEFLLKTNLMHFFIYLFIYFISLHVSNITVLIIRRSNCINTSSGVIYLCGCLVLLVRRDLTSIPSSHLHRLIIPDDALVQFDLLMMSTVMLETCRELK